MLCEDLHNKGKIEELLEASEDGTITAAQVTEAGLHRSILQEFVKSGEMYRFGRGLYVRSSAWEDWFLQKNLPYPTCWDDLTAPELEGQIVLASPETSGTSYTMLAALMQQRGEEKAWEYLQMLDANVGCYTHSGIEPVEKVKQGEFAVGIVFSHDGRRAALDGYPVMLCYPEDGTGYEIGACALVRGGPVKERENAERFIDWMTSQRGQECYIEAKSSRLPANSTARSADGLPAMKDIKTVEYDLEWAGSNRTRLIDEFQRRFPGAQTRKSLS